MLRVLVAAALVALVAPAGCGSGVRGDAPGGGPPPSSGAPGDPTRVSTQGRTVTERCPAEAWRASTIGDVTFEADGVELYAAELGTGPRGVVLVHGTGGTALCNWGNIAPVLARDGFHVLAVDQRCQGFSGCGPDGTAGLDRDVRAAVAALRDRGATRVALVGESRGGAVVLTAAAGAAPGSVAAVAALSPVWFPAVTGGPRLTGLTDVAPRVGAPTLYLAARGDRQVDEAELRAWAAATPHADVVVHDGSAHGAGLLGSPVPDRGYTRELLPFLRRRLS